MPGSIHKISRKKSAILEAARETFLSEGYIGTSMDRIAQKAGVTKQTVYRYFPSKEDLFQATLEALRARFAISDIHDTLHDEDARRGLLSFAIRLLAFHMDEDHLACIRLLVAEGRIAPEITRAFVTGPEATHSALVTFFRDRLHADDPEYAARMLRGTLLSGHISVLMGVSPVPTDEERQRHAERSVTLCLKCLNADYGNVPTYAPPKRTQE